ncbi:MAG: hypothetical protein FWE57_00035 [Chitinispirillia bacterium]|nr:hypothetical protein [Chitinispirillia bacterium]
MSKETMSISEKLDITLRAHDLKHAGDYEGYQRLLRTVPMPPYLAKVMKEKVGLDFLLSMGWNLSEVEAEFGSEWLIK